MCPIGARGRSRPRGRRSSWELDSASYLLECEGLARTNSVPSGSIACMMIARRLARATRALRVVDRLGIAKAQSLSLIWPLWRVDVSRATDADGSSIAATKARAVSCPTPGIVISRRQAAEALAIRLISGSNAATRRDDAESSGLGDVSDTELSPNPSRIRHAGLSVYGRWPTPRVDDGAKVFAGRIGRRSRSPEACRPEMA
jgi:hypothetical protein